MEIYSVKFSIHQHEGSYAYSCVKVVTGKSSGEIFISIDVYNHFIV